jgi:hypothetical protein
LNSDTLGVDSSQVGAETNEGQQGAIEREMGWTHSSKRETR